MLICKRFEIIEYISKTLECEKRSEQYRSKRDASASKNWKYKEYGKLRFTNPAERVRRTTVETNPIQAR